MPQMTRFQLIQVIYNWFSQENWKKLKGQPEAATNDDLQNTREKKKRKRQIEQHEPH